MSDSINKLLKDLTRLSNKIDSTKSTVGVQPLFGSVIELIKHAEAYQHSKYYAEAPEGLILLAETYDKKMRQFKEYVKGKSLSEKEMNFILYGN